MTSKYQVLTTKKGPQLKAAWFQGMGIHGQIKKCLRVQSTYYSSNTQKEHPIVTRWGFQDR